MKNRILLGTSIAALVLSAGAYAASPTPADQCATLIAQFDQEVQASSAASVEEAKALRTDGGKMCESQMYDEGIQMLKQALESIGVQPQT